jgi:hypothetical protein
MQRYAFYSHAFQKLIFHKMPRLTAFHIRNQSSVDNFISQPLIQRIRQVIPLSVLCVSIDITLT